MPAAARRAIPRGEAVLFASFLLLGATWAFVPPAHAADDSNAGQLTQTSTLNSQQLGATLSALAQGSNDTQIQSLVSQFNSQIQSGNYSGAAPTLSQLQGLSSQQNGSSLSLNALLQSLSVGSDGASVNSTELAGLLRSGSTTTDQSQQSLSTDMRSLASLLQYVNSTLASQLLQNSSLLSKNALGGAGASLGGAPVSLPGVSSLPSVGLPSVGAPGSIGAPVGGPPALSLDSFLIPLIAAVAVVSLYLSRGRLSRLPGSKSLAGFARLRGSGEEAEGGVVPSDPRGRIEFYFAHAVRTMARRGLLKKGSETHREFSLKCEGAPERPHVAALSSLYEKAKFSGQDVGSPEADLAASEFVAMGKEGR